MGEPIHESLMKVADVLRFFGRYEESNAVIALAKTCKALGLDTLTELEVWFNDKMENDDLHQK